MAGMMWRLPVALLVFVSWQACSVQELVNLVEPGLTRFSHCDSWRMFDHDFSTYAKERALEFRVHSARMIRPTKYRITMAAHVPRADYPEQWQVTRYGDYGDPAGEKRGEQVVGSVWINGMYEGTWREPMDIDLIRFRFPTKIMIAEIELLGPREALDALWPHGSYPCSRRHSVITTDWRPKKMFSRSKYATAKTHLRYVFNLDVANARPFYFDSAKPVIISAQLPELPTVHEVAVDADRSNIDGVMEKVVLQGSFCQPHCNEFGSKDAQRKHENSFSTPRPACMAHVHVLPFRV